jgi:DNA-binding transcriptional LysR family regulator
VDLAAERFDVALRLGLPATAPGDLVRRVGVSPRVLCASPSYVQRRGAPATTAELARHTLVGLGVADPMSAWTFAKGKRTVTVATSPGLRVNSSLLARELCRAGVGLALLPRFLARVDLASGALVDVALDAAPVAADVQLLLAASAARTAKVRAFVELIRELPRDAVEWT